jgi:hypothetical protein
MPLCTEKRIEMRLICKPWHIIVRLWCQLRSGNTPFRHRCEDRETPTRGQRMHKRGDENRFSSARQTCDAEPDFRLKQIARRIANGARSKPCLKSEIIKKTAGHQRPGMGRRKRSSLAVFG